MGMTPDNFFDSFVQGNYFDCVEHPGCIRRAFNAAISASHFADHFYTYYSANDPSKVSAFSSLGKFVEYASKNTDDCFKDIRSISNAYKHLYTSTDTKQEAYSSISSTGTIEQIAIDDKEIVEGSCTLDSDSESFSYKVVFTRKDGQQIEFLPTLERVCDFWQKTIRQATDIRVIR